MIILEGNAFVSKNREKMTIHARKIEILSKNKEAIAYGNVIIRKQDTTNKLFANQIKFNYSNEIFLAEGSPRMIDENNEIELSSRSISGNLKKDHFIANDDVELISKKKDEQYHVYASNAEYFSKDSTAKLWGGVRLLAGTEEEVEVTSHQMDFFKTEKEILFSDPKKVDIAMRPMESERTDRLQLGNSFTAKKVKYSFSSNKLLHCENDVLFTDLDTGSVASSKSLEYFLEEGYLRMTGNPQYKTSNAKVTVKGDFLEWFEEDDVICATGDVEIFYEDKTATAAWAFYFKRENKVLLYGDPKIRDLAGNEVYSQRIEVNLNDNSAELGDGVDGIFSSEEKK